MSVVKCKVEGCNGEQEEKESNCGRHPELDAEEKKASQPKNIVLRQGGVVLFEGTVAEQSIDGDTLYVDSD